MYIKKGIKKKVIIALISILILILIVVVVIVIVIIVVVIIVVVVIIIPQTSLANGVLTYSPNKGGTTGRGFLLGFYRSTFVHQDLPSSAKVPKPRYLSPGT